MSAHPLAKKLFPPVSVLGHRRIGVRLLQPRILRSSLLIGRINTGGRRIKEPFDSHLLGSHQHVGVDKYREHTLRLVQLDKTHPPHIGSQVVDPLHSLSRLPARLQLPQVQLVIIHIVELLIPLRKGLQIHRANVLDPLLPQVRHQMTADKAAGAGDQDGGFGGKFCSWFLVGPFVGIKTFLTSRVGLR